MGKITFNIKNASSQFNYVQIKSLDIELFKRQLSNHCTQLPGFFALMPVIVDATAVENSMTFSTLSTIIDIVKSCNLIVIGVRCANKTLTEKLNTLKIATFKNKIESTKEDSLDNANDLESVPTKIVDRVRSGQQIFANHGDLIVLNSVSSGSEIIAKGNIHVYGKLSGRAFAGSDGDIYARIFCKELDASLVAIAGKYTAESMPKGDMYNYGYHVFLANGKISIMPTNYK